VTPHAVDAVVETSGGGTLSLRVLVAPRASRTKILGVHDGHLKVALEAPPVDGAANAALIAFLAKQLGVPRRAISLLRGQSGRRKCVAIPERAAPSLRALIDATRSE
jgi:uncharacterized protein (TIGR00251 family)